MHSEKNGFLRGSEVALQEGAESFVESSDVLCLWLQKGVREVVADPNSLIFKRFHVVLFGKKREI
jgi:hypothetical protein